MHELAGGQLLGCDGLLSFLYKSWKFLSEYEMEMTVPENDCFTIGTRRESRKTRSRSGRGEGSCKVYISM